MPYILISTVKRAIEELTVLITTQKANHPHPLLSVICNIPKEHDVQALRQAMFTTQKTYPKLADWAAFNLVGAAQ